MQMGVRTARRPAGKTNALSARRKIDAVEARVISGRTREHRESCICAIYKTKSPINGAFRAIDGRRYWDRTNDLHDVNVAL